MSFLKRFKGVIVFLLIIAISYGGYSYYTKSTKKVIVPKLTTVTKGDVIKRVSATGSIAAIDNIEINSEITGRIVELYVKENDPVNKGDLLMQLDRTSYEAAKEQAEAEFFDAKLTYNRDKRLYEQGAIAKSTYDSAKADYLVAKANVKVAINDLENTEIRTPISGYIIGEPTPVGQTISSGISTPQVLMNVATLDNMEVETLVDESDIGSVKLGQNVEFTVDSYPDEIFTGKVNLISRDAEEEDNVIYYTVYVNVDNSKGKLFPTMTASTEIIIDKKKNVLKVPETSVKNHEGKNIVVVYNTKTNKERIVEVTKGLEGDYNVEISGDLKENDNVVTNPNLNSKTNNKENNETANNMPPAGPGGPGGPGGGPGLFR